MNGKRMTEAGSLMIKIGTATRTGIPATAAGSRIQRWGFFVLPALTLMTAILTTGFFNRAGPVSSRVPP